MTDDQYGSVLREKMKQVMEEPFTPLNRRQNPQPIKTERRKSLLRRWWYAHNEEVGMFSWMIAITMIGAGAWFLWGTWPR